MTQLPQTRIAQYRADIDGLRAIAVLLVLWFHAFPDSMAGGFIGVDVFFVISGYLITGIILRSTAAGTFRFLHFYAQRARRLLPSLTVVLAATLAAGWHWLWPREFEQLATHVAAATGFVLNFLLWTEAGYFDTATELKPIMHLWSLSVEEQFYLLYPCFLWLGLRLGVKQLVPIAVIFSASFAANLLWIQSDPSGVFFLPHTRFWELTVGGLLAWAQHKGPQDDTLPLPFWRQVLPWAGLAGIFAGALTLDGGVPYPGAWALMPVLGSAALIAAGPGAWVNRRLLGNRAMVWVGLISYPLYLWHWPLLSFAGILHADTPPAALRAALLAASILLAWLTYRYIETPIRFGRKRPLRLGMTVASLAATCAVALNVWFHAGMPSRVPGDAEAVLAYRINLTQAYREGTCFLKPEQEATALDNCPDPWPGPNGTWLLWGDSHAAHLYPGLRGMLRQDDLSLVQRTASGCPPLDGQTIMHIRICETVTRRVWSEIAANPPQRVTLAAFWTEYDWAKLRETIARLRELGVQDIEIVGPVPRWHNGLPKQAAVAYREAGFKEIPTHLSSGLNRAPFELDPLMAELAREQRVDYLSPIQTFCGPQGCLVRDNGSPSLFAWDDVHLTAAGSAYLARQWAGRKRATHPFPQETAGR